MARAHAPLGRRTWRRMERSAVRDHERDLMDRLHKLVGHVLEHAMASADMRALSFRFSGRLLLLGGVSPATASEVLNLASRSPLHLLDCGRYGPFWWVSVGDGDRRVTLASHLQLLSDRGRSAPGAALGRGPNATLRA